DAPLTRQPARGVSVRIGRRGLDLSAGHGRVSLRGLTRHSNRWISYRHGAERTTPFGRETVVVTPAKTEQFLTVERRQGTRTWRWRLDSAAGFPRVGNGGAVAFL